MDARPPVLDMERARLDPSHSEPFLCYVIDNGHGHGDVLPNGFPRSLGELESLGYLYAGSLLPQICVVNRYEDPESESEARETLMRCEKWRQPFWLSLESNAVIHPAWWPAVEVDEVPAYRTIIAGARESGIGMHRDAYNCKLVSTYITLGVGRKHVVLLPPTDEGNELALRRFQARDPLAHPAPYDNQDKKTCVRARIPPCPSAELVDAVVKAGGYWFDLVPAADGCAATLFMPGGWWHWLAGASECEWHVATSGSFYTPEAAIPAAARRAIVPCH